MSRGPRARRAASVLALGALVATIGACADHVTKVEPSAPSASAVTAEEIPAGAICAQGGFRVYTGIDANRNGLLDDAERTESYVLCNGADGSNGTNGVNGANGLIATAAEPVGPNCADGGTKISSGLDVDGNGALDPGEVTKVSYACNGAVQATLVDVNASGAWVVGDEAASCGLALGTEFVVYLDHNASSTYEAGVDTLVSSGHVCNGSDGVDGLNSAIAFTAVGAGVGGCLAGGYRVEIGLDASGDGVLDPAEVDATYYLCDGRDASVGINQGDAMSPAALPLEHVNAEALSTVGTVAASGASYYHAQTYTDASATSYDAPYTLLLGATESDLAVSLYADAGWTTPVALACPTVSYWGKICSTASLAAGADYYLRLDETYDVPNQFWMSLSYGANEGSWRSPLAIGTVAGSLTHAGSVATGGLPVGASSVYGFDVAADGIYTATVSNVVSLPVEAGPYLSLYFDGSYCMPATPTGNPLVCVGDLLAGMSHWVQVDNAGSGATFDVTIEAGDGVTPVAAMTSYATSLGAPTVNTLDVGIYMGALYQFTPTVDGPVTLLADVPWTLYRGYFSSGAAYETSCSSGRCTTGPLIAGEAYYVALGSSDTDPTRELVIYDASFDVGDTGSAGSPALVINAPPLLSSVADLGMSSYGFDTTVAPTDVTITVSAHDPSAGITWAVANNGGAGTIVGSCGTGAAATETCSLSLTPADSYVVLVHETLGVATLLDVSVSSP